MIHSRNQTLGSSRHGLKTEPPHLAAAVSPRTIPAQEISADSRRRLRQRFRRSQLGITLVEIIGVLAIITILAALLVPAVLRQMQHAEQEAEARTMTAIAAALEEVVLGQKVLPGTSDWVAWVAPELDRPAQDLATSSSGCARRLVYHPSSAIQPGAPARTQTASGFQNLSPGFDRILVVSTLRNAFPGGLDLSSPATFEALWDTAPHQRPAGWTAAALPDPDDLHIARLDLGKLLHRVVINDLSPKGKFARISLEENGTTEPISNPSEPRTPWERSFIHGTGLNLLVTKGLGGPTIGSRELINEDRTLYHSDTGWGFPSVTGPSDWSIWIAMLCQDFINADFPKAQNGQRPRAAVDELYRALWTYMDWADAGFLEGGNNKNDAPDAYVVRSTVARLNVGTLNLLGSGGGGN